jgi:hypothetical protein
VGFGRDPVVSGIDVRVDVAPILVLVRDGDPIGLVSETRIKALKSFCAHSPGILCGITKTATVYET